MQIPLLAGAVASKRADWIVSLSVNLEPIPSESGISKGYIRSTAGAVTKGTGPGTDRGGINWNDQLYRVMGSKLVRIDAGGGIVTLGDVGDGGAVALDYGFDRLAIQSGTNLYYWDNATLTQVSDGDLGACIDVVWMDGYFISTDGTSIVVTDLADPSSVNPLRYGSAEADPDMVTGLFRLRSELYVLGENTIQVFTDEGGTGFPFTVNNGATIPIGCVGPRAKCRYSQSFAFVGAQRNGSLGVWLAGSGTASKLSTREVDQVLAQVLDPSQIELEARDSEDEQRLFVHLPDRSLVFLFSASQASQTQVWYETRSGLNAGKAYRPRHAVLCYNQWWVGDTETASYGTLTNEVSEQFGETTGYRFDTQFLYNGGNGGIVHELELVALPGRQSGIAPVLFLSVTLDGETYSQEKPTRGGSAGQRAKRIIWNPHKRFRRYMGLRFRGYGGLPSFAALEAQIEALSV